ncbi:MAG: NADH-quinone oxidoreductase subunit N, partial [bacterium]
LLAAFMRGQVASQEAGLKYLLIGAFSGALFLFGLSLLYAATGTTMLSGLTNALAGRATDPLLLFGLILVLAALGFKIAAVPFHMWAPDVYEGGPTPMVAFASTASKAAGFVVLLRLVLGALRAFQADWTLILSVSAALTLVIGSFVAIPQTNIKRLLAYSSIAQAGYLLIGFLPGSERGMSAVLFYLLVYLFTNMGAFLVAGILARDSGSDQITDFAGLARRSPLLALAMMFCLLSLAGIPPLGGFVGKLYLFAAAMEYPAKFLWLVVLAVILSIVSLFYYLQVIRQMYIEKPRVSSPVPVGRVAGAALFVCIAMVVVTGLLPRAFLDVTLDVARRFFAA